MQTWLGRWRRGTPLGWGGVLLCALGLLAACGRVPESTDAGEAQVVRIGYFPNLTHAQGVMGVHSGDFARAVAPARLQTRVFSAGPSLVEALFAGEIDVAYLGPAPAVLAFARSGGKALRIVSGAACDGVVLVARHGSGIESIRDLRGKRLATPQLGNTQDVSARHFIAAALGGVDAVEILPMSAPEQGTMLRRGQIDAAWAVEPWASRWVVEQGAQEVVQERQLWEGQSFALSVMVTTPDFLNRHPDLVEALIRVNAHWTRQLSEDPEGSLADLEAALFVLNGKRLPAGVLERAMTRVRFVDRPPVGSIQAFADWMQALGYVRRPVKAGEMLDLRALDKVLSETKEGTR